MGLGALFAVGTLGVTLGDKGVGACVGTGNLSGGDMDLPIHILVFGLVAGRHVAVADGHVSIRATAGLGCCTIAARTSIGHQGIARASVNELGNGVVPFLFIGCPLGMAIY